MILCHKSIQSYYGLNTGFWLGTLLEDCFFIFQRSSNQTIVRIATIHQSIKENLCIPPGDSYGFALHDDLFCLFLSKKDNKIRQVSVAPNRSSTLKQKFLLLWQACIKPCFFSHCSNCHTLCILSAKTYGQCPYKQNQVGEMNI